MSPERRGSLAAQIQPRLVATVAVMALLLVLTTVFAARAILYNQLDRELDAAFKRQDRTATISGHEMVPGIDVPGMREGTVVALLLPTKDIGGNIVGDGRYLPLTLDAGMVLVDLPVDGNKHTVSLPGMGRYRAEARTTRMGQVSVALPTHEIDRSLLWLTLFAAGVSLLAISATALVTREVLDRATKHLKRLTNTADDVSHLELERGTVAVPRVAVGELPENNEVTRLSMAFNQMLGRVEGALGAREASERKLRRFVADASHELRNPLAAIRGYAELAQRAPDGDDAQFAMGRIESESTRMSKLVNDLLLLARLDADAQSDPGPVDAVEVVLNAVSDAQAASRDHRWLLDLPEEGAMVLADADQLHQVMVNLLANARTHTPPGTTVSTTVRRLGLEDPAVVVAEGRAAVGGPEGRAGVSGPQGRAAVSGPEGRAGVSGPEGRAAAAALRPDGRAGGDLKPKGRTSAGHLRPDGGAAVGGLASEGRDPHWAGRPATQITVRDDGPGIPPEILPTVFERFTRADDARAHSTAHSTGLGLAIVRAIVEGLGGTAEVTSEPGNTCFTITLPVPTEPTPVA